jgi:hypothetical protein
VPGDLIRVGQPGIGVFGRLACHRHRAFGHVGNRARRNIGGRDTGLTPTDQHTQPDLDPFRTFGLFQRARPHVDRHRAPIHRNRIGGVRSRLGGSRQKCTGQIGKSRVGHEGS